MIASLIAKRIGHLLLIMKTITLNGSSVALEPLKLTHLNDLQAAACDGELWNLFFVAFPRPGEMLDWLKTALDSQDQGKALAFVVRENSSSQIVGTTRFYDIDSSHKRLNIGYTWYAKRVQRTAINTECKLLLLRYAFEELKCNVVTFQTDWLNQISQRAIERLGAKRDGILRNHMIMANGRIRDTVIYSILNTEWKGIEQNLIFKLNMGC